MGDPWKGEATSARGSIPSLSSGEISLKKPLADKG